MQIKNICYEFIPGFLPCDAIVEVIQQYDPNIQSRKIIEAYGKILNAIPRLWKNELHVVNPVHVDRLPSFTVGENMTEFLLATTKFFYKLLLQDFSESPISENFWSHHYPSVCFRSLYRVVNQCHLPPECVSLNYRVATNTIFTLSKLQRINKVDDGTCLLCNRVTEDLFHLWCDCPTLQSFKSFIIDK